MNLIRKFQIPTTYTVQKKKGSGLMYYGTKGWYVAELKKLGVRYHEGRKLESYRGHVLRNLLIAQQEQTKEEESNID
ncbi:YflJ family protein [Bacillus toyonensis]|uniref:YflJ family protein n=1 Tax=Bacillus toyonensis TaxID=155322 RepID=UPI002877DB71|nr:YflJ family protein [Bacillus toyonensis]